MTSLWTSLINHRDIRAGGSNRAVTMCFSSESLQRLPHLVGIWLTSDGSAKWGQNGSACMMKSPPAPGM